MKALRSFYWKTRIRWQDFQNQFRSRRKVFENIYDHDGWGNKESKSGSGSTVNSAQKIIERLPKLFQHYSIQTMLDIPCGDFNWMREVSLSKIQYTGADIVSALIKENQKKFSSPTLSFIEADLAVDSLPKVDLILCRDCLVHLSYKDIFKCLENIAQSKSSYLLATTFTEHQNTDIVTGNWRPLNLQQAPFFLPAPIQLITENCIESEGQYQDKALGLWYVKDLVFK